MTSKALLHQAATQHAQGIEHEPQGLPKYLRIIESLTARLAAREWEPGAALHSESALAEEYGVSHGTMRKAIDQLVKRNFLVRRHGTGTFAAVHDWNREVTHFIRLVGEDGRREVPMGRIIKRQVGRASATEAARLRLKRPEQVLRILRVKNLNETPALVERLVLPVRLFGGLAANAKAELPPLLYAHYSREFGVFVAEAVEHLRAVAAGAVDARLLGVPLNHPLLEIDRLALDISGQPVEWRISHCDTRHHHYLNRLS